ncbi:MAG: MBL fold metallo-hydrolase [Bryobacteraceae bacterium]
MNPFRIELQLWGVRGSIPTPAPENLGFGGNTTCLELRLPGGEVLVIDGGTGARKLGLSLLERARGRSLDLNILMTHFHWDHIQGIPFFAPLYSPANRITFHSTKDPAGVSEILEGQMTHPYFPVAFELLAAQREFQQLSTGPTQLGGASVRTFPLCHPQGATGYRVEAGGAVIVHACDHEHGDPRFDEGILENAMDADILIYDAQFTPEEYKTKKGWGHSTWLEATRVAKAARVKRLLLFHHDPSHTDDQLRAIAEDAAKEFPNVEAASEGATFTL